MENWHARSTDMLKKAKSWYNSKVLFKNVKNVQHLWWIDWSSKTINKNNLNLFSFKFGFTREFLSASPYMVLQFVNEPVIIINFFSETYS